MILEKRLEMITRLIQVEGIVDVDYLSHYLEVSPKTIRLDLSLLEKKGVLKRVHGGATIVTEKPAKDQSFTNIRRSRFIQQKRIIATEARKLIKEGDTILLDDGSTIYELAKILDGVNVTVFTNDIQILNVLIAKPNVSVHIIGGRVQKNGDSYVVAGSDAVEYMQNFRVDKLFLATSTVDTENGLMLFYYGDSAVKKSFISASNQVILLADSSKFGVSAAVRFAKLEDIDVIITDTGLSTQEEEKFKQVNDMKLIIAG